jgi:Tol biopolymer transport system component
MKLAGAVLALALVLLGTTMGTAATSGEGRIVFASGLPTYPPPANLNVSRIYSIGVDGRRRRNIGGAVGADASLSPDGTKIAYWDGGGLWVMNADGSSQRKVMSPGPQEGSTGPPLIFDGGVAWSPDGTKLAVSGVVVDLDGAVVGRTGHDPAWSPDGKWIVSVFDERDYDGSKYEGPDWQIVVSSLDGTASRELTKSIPIPDYACWANPSWSPDGTRIAASLLICHAAEDVWLRSYLFPVGTGPRRVLAGASPPVWSPDGTKLAFLRQHVHADGYVDGSALNVARGDGSQARVLSAADPWGAPPVWASKGGRLAYASERTGQIETIAVDGRGRRRVTHELADSFLIPFAWSGDASRILYTAAVTPEHSHIWTMSPAGDRP